MQSLSNFQGNLQPSLTLNTNAKPENYAISYGNLPSNYRPKGELHTRRRRVDDPDFREKIKNLSHNIAKRSAKVDCNKANYDAGEKNPSYFTPNTQNGIYPNEKMLRTCAPNGLHYAGSGCGKTFIGMRYKEATCTQVTQVGNTDPCAIESFKAGSIGYYKNKRIYNLCKPKVNSDQYKYGQRGFNSWAGR